VRPHKFARPGDGNLPIRFYFKKAKQKLANSKRGAGQGR
jgi:hypothetical protein